MTLEVHRYTVASIAASDETALVGSTLHLDLDELRAVVLEDRRLAGVEFSILHPGDQARIVRVLDILEPRAKTSGEGWTFPGVSGAADNCGAGVTSALSGVAIVANATLSPGQQTFVQEDCLIDMFGTGASLTPFSRTANLVVSYEFTDPEDAAGSAAAVCEADVRLARHLAACTKEETGADVVRVPLREDVSPSGDLPRVVYICSVISEGFLHDTLLHGRTTEDMEPIWLDPVEFIDGALVSTDFHYACQRVPTYLYQNNPVIWSLLEMDARELDLVGVIVVPRYGTDDHKLEGARRITEMCARRDATGVIVHPAVGGNAQLDALYVVQETTRAGMAASMMVQEMAGPRGEDLGLVDHVPEADLLISTGNRDEVVELPGVDRTVGGTSLLDGRDAGAPIDAAMRLLCCSTSQVGALSVRGVPV